mgnify:CR=1 FL=1
MVGREAMDPFFQVCGLAPGEGMMINWLEEVFIGRSVYFLVDPIY